MSGPTLQDFQRVLGGSIDKDAHGAPVLHYHAEGHVNGAPENSLWLTPDKPGGFRVSSFIGGDWRTECDRIGRLMGFPAWEPPPKLNGHRKPPRRKVIERYVYQRVDAGPWLRVSRTMPKSFFQEHSDDGGKTWKPGGIPAEDQVPFRMVELIEGVALGKRIHVVEGEADVLALERHGLVATTNAGGASKWWPSLNRWFHGADVVIVPDADPPGRLHARKVAESLKGVAAAVKVVCLPGLPEHGDVSNWLQVPGNNPHAIADLPDADFAEPERRAKERVVPDGAVTLDAVHALLGQFIAYPSEHAHVANTLWVAHAHLMEAFEYTPRLAALSPEPASGKSRLLETTALLVPRPVEAMNVSAAYLVRRIGDEAGRPTILFDEVDAVFGSRAPEHEDLRGMLNAGHHRGAVYGRCVVRGKSVTTEDLPCFAAVALGGLGDLPGTLMSRAIVIRMRRRAPTEKVEPFRRRQAEAQAEPLRAQLAAWAAAIEPTLEGLYPEMPDGVEDRDADVWEPLLVVADAAGGTWPQRARAAAVALVTEARRETPSLGVRLLADLKLVFAGHERLSTTAILDALVALDESPWGDLRGKPLDARGLANRLRPYGVGRATFRVGTATFKGYQRADLADAWDRYVSPPPGNSETSVTAETTYAGPLGE
jgi:hypothetical protein